MKTIYLDNASATPLRKEVLEVMLPYLKDVYGNASSLHHKGRESSDTLARAREQVAKVLGVQDSEVIFTGSGTEANNLALFGIAHAYSARGKHILVSSIEHPSVLSAVEALRGEGFEIEYLPVDGVGRVSVPYILSKIRTDTILISLMYANNEIGTIEPVTLLGKMLRETYAVGERPLLHTDACQASGQLPIAPSLLNVDLMTLNGGKIYGPKGVGMLYVRHGIRLTPRIVGGNQEHSLRAGTENIAGIVGFAQALMLIEEKREEQSARVTELREYFTRLVEKRLPEAILNGSRENRLPNNIHFSIPYIEGESLLLLLDTYGICASTGSACSSHNLSPSHVLRAIGQSDELMHGSIRFSLGCETTREDVEYTVNALVLCAKRLKELSPLPLKL